MKHPTLVRLPPGATRGTAHLTGQHLGKQPRKKQHDDRPPLSREDRLLKKHKGTLRCEWCGRRSEVRPPDGERWSDWPLKTWRKFVEKKAPWSCERPRCIANRS